MIAGDRGALGTHDVGHQEVPVVAAQPRQQTCAQERRLAHPGRAKDHEQAFHTRRAHAAQRVQAAEDLRVAAEEHRRVGILHRLPPAIRDALRIFFGRPREVFGADPGVAQPAQQSRQTVGAEDHRFAVIGGRP